MTRLGPLSFAGSTHERRSSWDVNHAGFPGELAAQDPRDLAEFNLTYSLRSLILSSTG